MESQSLKGGRSALRRRTDRGIYDRETINNILDAAYLCHLGFQHQGQPFIIPTAYGRVDNQLYLHGAVKSRTMMALTEGAQLCLSVTHLDGLVLARSAFHHSMNYRSVILFGQCRLVEDDSEKLLGMKAITEQILAGRWDECRQPNTGEMKATTILAFPIEEGSAKIRSGGPKDDPNDYALDIWAGVVPLKVVPQAVEEDPLAKLNLPHPPSVSALIK
ncbi:MAG: pyridoxamine 5'-phosphate oxidase family protein [Bacteroidota bacterium]